MCQVVGGSAVVDVRAVVTVLDARSGEVVTNWTASAGSSATAILSRMAVDDEGAVYAAGFVDGRLGDAQPLGAFDAVVTKLSWQLW